MLVTGHYPYCKACIKAYIESIGEKSWHSILTRLKPPMMENEKGRVPKLASQWTIEEECLTNSNFKALFAMFCGLDLQEFKRVAKCSVAKYREIYFRLDMKEQLLSNSPNSRT
ncbi:hypothetical protein CXB51_007839 [Gossypium anomalum]|uniref:Uncharacterized protein n=1 Tax=Gossypium anomalum TaxID=47600 RepID=A0A8J5ZCI7_9ROSI|nr:hypothetical protein CXB51_007839 [Gossypium anomalum]